MPGKITKLDTEQTAGQSAKQPVDATAQTSNNQTPSAVKMKALNLEDDKPQAKKPTKGSPMTQDQKKKLIVLFAVAAVAGIGTGFGAFRLRAQSAGDTSPKAEQQVAGDNVQVGDVFGVKDDQTFKDSAEGYLEAGGINGEGSHSLLREGGESQTVYLTSSITDLDKLVGMRVKVWGETFKGQKAGWLMDVGRVQVLELDAEAPTE